MRKVNRKNGKVYEGLSSIGIAHQIKSSLRCFHDWNGTPNDCQLTINPLVRAYHVMLMRESGIELPSTPLAKQARADKKSAIREHVIPAHEVVCRLMDVDPSCKDFDYFIKEILDSTFNVAWVVKEEHKRLNSKHMHSLPVKPEATPQQLAELRYELCEVPVPTY